VTGPRGGRSGSGGTDAGGVDPDVALFAQWMRDEERKERDARRQAKENRRLEESARSLTAAKDAAAAEVKRLRWSPSATAEQRAAADAAYRDALAAVVAAETGEAPAWAPAVAESGADGTDDGTDDERDGSLETEPPVTADEATGPPADAGTADASADAGARTGPSAGDTPEG
jgi:hypothetical protein